MILKPSEAPPQKGCRNDKCDRHTPEAKTFCSRCQKRWERHRDPNYVWTASPCKIPGCPKDSASNHMCLMHDARVRRFGDPHLTKRILMRLSRPRCKNLWCAGLSSIGMDDCVLCRRAEKRGRDPEARIRKYKTLCRVTWCWKRGGLKGFCRSHHYAWKRYGSVLGTIEGRMPIPTTCVLGCGKSICARGLCVSCLILKAKKDLLLREFLPVAQAPPWHKPGPCIGRPNCGKKAIFLGRCANCLWDWQFTLIPPRRYLR